MRACVAASPKLSGAMQRVAGALARWAPPEIDIVPTPELADLVVVHTIGTDVWPLIESLEHHGKRFAMMQYCLRTTQEPEAWMWMPYWRRAAAVWSYYDLDAALVGDEFKGQACPWCDEELPHLGQGTGATDFPRCFYYAPLGADPETFSEQLTLGERFVILTSGYVAESECIAECWAAAARVGRRVFHLGPPDEFRDLNSDHVEFGYGITDTQLARAYSRSDYVAGMRRCEGFEMPAVEGLLCGARPLMLDAPHYRRWFEPWAMFVPETGPEELTDNLERVFAKRPPMVIDIERDAAAERFNWERLVGGFWSRILEEPAR